MSIKKFLRERFPQSGKSSRRLVAPEVVGVNSKNLPVNRVDFGLRIRSLKIKMMKNWSLRKRHR